MGQSSSTAAAPGSLTRSDTFHATISKIKSATSNSSSIARERDVSHIRDGCLISDLPDECISFVFHFLDSADRIRCSLVCHRWLEVEGQSRHRLSLHAESDLSPFIPSLFSRFDSVTKLSLKCDRRSVSICDDALMQISLRCQHLSRLKLRACRGVTDAGMESFAKNCKGLKKLSIGSCTFGVKGMNAVLDNSPNLEELSVKRLRGLTADGDVPEPIGPGVAGSSLKTICLKELYNGQCFCPLIAGSKNLRTIKLFRCSGSWDKPLQLFAERVTGFTELHLEKVQVTDIGLSAISNCSDLEILHLVKTPECTNAGLLAVAERCKFLRKLHIDGWKANLIGDVGLMGVANYCPNLQELVLIGVNPTHRSLELLASKCQNLERLALCGSDTVGDNEISSIASKCIALKKLCIKSCPVSDHGLQALAGGCPNLVKVKVKKCKGVSIMGMEWLRGERELVDVNLDYDIENHHNTRVGVTEIEGHESIVQVGETSNTVSSRSAMFRSKLGILSGKNLVACTLRRLSSSRSHSRCG